MALDIGALSSSLSPSVATRLAELVRTDSTHLSSDGESGILDGVDSSDFSLAGLGGTKAGAKAGAAAGASAPSSFEDALLKALDGVSASQAKSDDILTKMVADPDSVDVQDVTIAMAEANMSLNLAKTILSRVVTAWKDVINTR
jgi:flagellar hook-basal body complex protein FliE